MSGEPLAAALGLDRPGMVAAIGSGGKTSLLQALAAELAQGGAAVAMTTTTRIWPPTGGGVWLWGEATPGEGEIARRLTPGGVGYVARGVDANGKLTGLGPRQAAALAAKPGRWVLVEADGAAGRPLKAWAPWEPVVPAGADWVLLLVGMAGLGRPLAPATVHRPELFAEGSGLAPGSPVTPAALARVLLGPLGPLARLGGRRPLLVLTGSALAPPDAARTLARELAGEMNACLLAAEGFSGLMPLGGGG